MSNQNVHASVKDERLIEIRRNQMITGAVSLFKEKGFHRTTTREIARAAGFSIGTLYEYIRQKEDVLYLVCDRIYDQVRERLNQDIDPNQGSIENLKKAISNYFIVMDEMQDEVLVMYQEAKSLTKDTLPYVLKKELEMVEMFESILSSCVENGEISLTDQERKLMSHNIFVQGQMWGFRRWVLQKLYTLEEYTNLQIENLLKGIRSK
jgi:AcrR family transcriptional regulator